MESHSFRSRRTFAGLLGVAAVVLAGAMPAAAERLRVGKAVAQNFGYVPLNVGLAQGLFQKEGLEIDWVAFGGGSKQVQALTAGAIDIALGGGTDMAFIVKGAPEVAVATISETPAFFGISVGAQSPALSADDLKGKRIGVSTIGSLTMWLVDELNRVKGWRGDGAVPVVIGGEPTAEFAALKAGLVDGMVGAATMGYLLEEQKNGRLLLNVSEYVKEFEVFTIFASRSIRERQPDAVRRFLKAWYDTVAYMRTHRTEAIGIARQITGSSQAVEEREYDALMPEFSTDGGSRRRRSTSFLPPFSTSTCSTTRPTCRRSIPRNSCPRCSAAAVDAKCLGA
jgi:ABC-type nitrate/sulfonate/bicarbonate transport system substrate-binding protein